MKKMRIALASMLVAAGITATAGAANFTNCADRLKDVGLFQGTNQGYQLDKAPTRAEASAMLVRLLGKEAEAEKLTYTAPFTDLKGWEKPYVQYLYDNGLANGMSATAYNPTGKCSAQMYTTFLLRALGYSDAKGDFTYAKALDFGEQVGLVDDINCSTKNFLRDNVVAMSLTALDTDVKGSDSILLDKLVADGAVDKTKAASLGAFFADADAFNTAAENTSAESKMAMDMDISANIKKGMTEQLDMSMLMGIKADIDSKNLDKSVMEMSGHMTVKMPSSSKDDDNSVTQDINYYFTNGTYYMDMGEQGKYKMAMSFDNVLNGMEISTMNSNIPISAIESITKGNGGLTAKYNINNVLGSEWFDDLLGSMLDGVSIKTRDMNVTAKAVNGKITDTSISGTVDITAEGETISATLNAAVKVTATGDAVKITLPTNLASYEEWRDTPDDNGDFEPGQNEWEAYGAFENVPNFGKISRADLLASGEVADGYAYLYGGAKSTLANATEYCQILMSLGFERRAGSSILDGIQYEKRDGNKGTRVSVCYFGDTGNTRISIKNVSYVS